MCLSDIFRHQRFVSWGVGVHGMTDLRLRERIIGKYGVFFVFAEYLEILSCRTLPRPLLLSQLGS